jgi:HEAT repeat protein
MQRIFKAFGWSQLSLMLLAVTVVLSLAGNYNQSAEDWQDNAWQEDGWKKKERRRKEILKKIPTTPDIMINITWDLMPGTPELTALGRKATKALVKGLLDNANDGIRSTCAGVLSQIRDPDAAPALVEALKDRNEMVRQQALVGLSNLADPKYGKEFLRLIEDPEETYWVKQTAVSGIGKVGYVKSLKALYKMLKSEDQQFAWEALAALWHMRNKAKRNDLVDIFMHVLKEEKGGANLAIGYLGALKAEEAVKVLAKYYVGKDQNVKNQIILAMGKIGNSAAKKFLKKVLRKTQVARHLNNAAIALADLGERKETITILLALLNDRKAYMRINAAFALGEINSVEDNAVQGLVTALTDRNDYVRSEAAVALGRIKSKAGVPALLELANGTNPFVTLDAVVALNRIDFKQHRQLIFDKLLVHKKKKLRRIFDRGIRFLAEQQDPAALPYLLRDLRTTNTGLYQSTLQLLRDYDVKDVDEFQPSLHYLTHTCNYYCFSELLRTLREWRQADYTEALLERLYRMYYGTEKTLVYFTLGKIAPKETAKRIARIKEVSHTPWMYQQFALANLGDDAAGQKLVDIVRDGTLKDKRDAAFLLGALDSKAMLSQLEELMRKADPFTAVSAAGALLGHGNDEAFKFLYEVMKDGTPIVADEAARVFLVSDRKEVDSFLGKQIGKEGDIVTKRRSEELMYQRKPKEFR